METKFLTIIGSVVTLAVTIVSSEYRVRSTQSDHADLGNSCSIALQHTMATSFEQQKIIDLAVDRNKEMFGRLMECLND